MLFAETTWPDVGMAFVQLLLYIATTIAALVVQWVNLSRKIGDVRDQAARGAEKLSRVETGLKRNTDITEAVQEAVQQAANGNGSSACNWIDPAQTISSRMTKFQEAMVNEIAGLKSTVAKQTTEIVELKKQLEAKG